MTFGGAEEGIWGHIGRLQLEDAQRLIARALEAGINFIDTADVYAEGRAEIITGQALKNLGIPRENVVIATKGLAETGTKSVNSRGMSRCHILRAAEASLKRLQLDHVDLYQIHGFDPATRIEEAVRVLEDLVRRGLARYVGVSNWAAWQIMKALGIAERGGFARVESVQAYYTIAGRDIEREIVPLLENEGLALMVWSPLAGGLLSGKYGRGAATDEGSRRRTFDFPPVNLDRAYDCVDAMRAVAAAHHVSVAQVALAWLLHRPAVTSVILGAKTLQQLEDNIAAGALRLTADERAALDSVSALPADYPGWMIERQTQIRRKQLADAREP
jgi:aryl-alcohol dehydrogenase-like predicted oxidoreductase